jgi:hypothetical protein
MDGGRLMRGEDVDELVELQSGFATAMARAGERCCRSPAVVTETRLCRPMPAEAAHGDEQGRGRRGRHHVAAHPRSFESLN